MSAQPKIAYDIQVIHDCIVRDTDIYRTFQTKSKKEKLFREKKKLLNGFPAIKKMITKNFVGKLDPKYGKFVGRVGWIPTELVITDDRIREMCQNMFTYPKEYAAQIGREFGPCPGSGKGSACPPYSYTAQEARRKLDQADIFIVMQSKVFKDFNHFNAIAHPSWHEFLLRKLKKKINEIIPESVSVVFGAGACRLCHPKPCLGDGECRVPEHRVYALEAVGVPVAQLCSDVALLTGDDKWKIKFIKYFATPKQTHKDWKFTCGLSVRLH